ncbi:MAG: hypothetical protein JO065_13025 [Acidobacteria bacterium]|nr:hypothetical protein [Acidobacteriota bacterium]
MAKAGISVAEILRRLEIFYGRQQPNWPTDPYLFLIWWHCGYPASDRACAKGWESLNQSVGVDPTDILSATPATLSMALKPGGMVPELRALRLKEIASRIKDEFGGDFGSALVGPIAKARKILKSFPNISDPGADRILLFAGMVPIAAIPSNCPYVLVRVFHGRERENYRVTYTEAQSFVSAGVPENLEARMRAYLLLKRHGQEVCKTKNPKCSTCPLSSDCAFFAGRNRGRGASAQ